MPKMRTLRLFIIERLAAAAEEIWGMVETTITEEVFCLKQEIERLHRAAAEPRPFLAVPEKAPHGQQHPELDITSRLVNEELMEFTLMNEEELDLGRSHVGDQLQEEEEASDLEDFIFSPTCVTSAHDKDQTRTPNLQLSVENGEETEKLRPKAAEVSQTSSAVNQDDPDAQRSNNEPVAGKTRGPQLGQQVVIQIIRAQPVSTAVSDSSQTPQDARAQGKDQVKLTVAQLDQLTQGAQKLMVQGQGGKTTGQLQVIPQGVDVACGPGQELMLATLPDGQVQRFLFTSMLPATTSSTGQAGQPVVTQIKLTLTQLTQWTQGEGGKTTGVNVTRGPGQELLQTTLPPTSESARGMMTRELSHHLTPKSKDAPSPSLCYSQNAKTKRYTERLRAPTEKRLNRWWGKRRKRSWIEQVNQAYPSAQRSYKGSAAWRMRGSQLGTKVAKSQKIQPVKQQLPSNMGHINAHMLIIQD